MFYLLAAFIHRALHHLRRSQKLSIEDDVMLGASLRSSACDSPRRGQ
jgi:hypothetical protein